MSAPEPYASHTPRALTAREREWCDWLLPRDRAAYEPIAEAIDAMMVIGIGRWGGADLVLGHDGQSVDLEAPMEPVAAYGEIGFENESSLSISIHQPDDEGRIEMHLSGPVLALADEAPERSRWCYSYWRPGDPAPPGGAPPREIAIDTSLTLALDSTRRVIWLHDAMNGGNTLVPVTNLYNELMLLKGVRDPAIALAHRRLFELPAENDDEQLREAFRRYNRTWRKVDASRLGEEQVAAPARGGLLSRLGRALRGGSKK